jgi:hypothetical protein
MKRLLLRYAGLISALLISVCTTENLAAVCPRAVTHPDLSDKELIVRAIGFAKSFREAMGNYETTNLYAGTGIDKVCLKTKGIPDFKSLETVAGTVFRHYVGEQLITTDGSGDTTLTTAFLDSGPRLIASPMHLTEGDDQWFRHDFVNVHGVFLTLPNFKPEEVGVLSKYYVDFTLDPKMPVFKANSKIFFIAGDPGQLVVPIRLVKHGVIP